MLLRSTLYIPAVNGEVLRVRLIKKLRPGESDFCVVDAWGETSFLAVARVFVMSRLGACVTIPAELAA